jgi:iron(III) transport system ATP-binding protein
MALRVHNLNLELGGRFILRDLSFEIPSGSLFCLLGPSGCGKSTLLRVVAGIQAPGSGEVWIRDQLCWGNGVQLEARKRAVGLVFQDALLFPHLNLRENIAFGLHGQSSSEVTRVVDRWIEVFDLKDQQRLRPAQLSGGQAQRVALARALACRPKLLLLDEPFSNLDPQLKERLKDELRDLQKREKITTLFVTHDQHEAFDLADEIGVMKSGTMVQQGAGYSVYHEPKTPWVAQFLGRAAFLPVQLRTTRNGTQVESPLGSLTTHHVHTSQCGSLLVRPDDVVHDDPAPTRGTVVKRNFRGIYQILHIRLEDGSLVQSMAPSHHDHRIGESVGLRLEMDHVIVFEEPSSRT